MPRGDGGKYLWARSSTQSQQKGTRKKLQLTIKISSSAGISHLFLTRCQKCAVCAVLLQRDRLLRPLMQTQPTVGKVPVARTDAEQKQNTWIA